MHTILRKKTLANAQPLEWQIQASLVKWARLQGLLLLSIPNGAKRSYAMASRERAIGLLSGACDLFLAMPGRLNGILYHGYWIELKVPGKIPTSTQNQFMRRVRVQGYKAEWFTDWVAAKESIEEYLREGYHVD